MDRLDKATLEHLTANEGPPAVTIYVPMHTSASPPHISENQIRLKNLLHQAAEKVRTVQKHLKLADELEQAVAQLHDDLTFWEEQTPGLLICARPGSIEMFHLPL